MIAGDWEVHTSESWRRRRESNPGTGLCRPLPKPLGHVASCPRFLGSEQSTLTRATPIGTLEQRARCLERPQPTAGIATLSPSRFRHLFVQETGTSFRAYLLWLRINVAIEAAIAGASWTAAAHEAGFADSSHLTRTHKRMFGIEPTAIRHD